MRSASSAARSCSGALFVLAVLTLAGLGLGGEPLPQPALAPTITATVPSADAMGVDPNSTIQVTFSEAMDPATVNVSIQPLAALSRSWVNASVLDVTPDPPGLTNCTIYTVTIGGNDTDEGIPLAAGSVPNPWSFLTACDRPYVVSTVPADGARSVLPDADVVVTFSEAIDCTIPQTRLTFLPALSPPGTFTTSCSANLTVWTLRFTGGTRFTTGATYTATMTAQSNDTHDDLVPSPVSNPWTFFVNAPPLVSKPSLSRSGCLDSGTLLRISWTMSDEDAATTLSVRLSYVDGTTWVTFHGPATGFPAAATYDWVLPPADVTTRVRVEVTDSAPVSTTNESDGFRIDAGPPRITSTTPPDGSTGFPRDSAVVIVFSEPMDPDSVNASISTDPPMPGSTLVWVSSSAVRIVPVSLPGNATYTVTVGPTALDTCDPGRSLAPGPVPNPFTFTTAKAQSFAPGFLRVLTYDETTVTLEWGGVSRYETGDPIPAGVSISYRVFRDNGTGLGLIVGTFGANRTTDRGLLTGHTYTYWVIAIVDGVPSDSTYSVVIRTLDPLLERPEGRLSVLVALAAVGVAGAAGAWMRQRRKKAEAQAAMAGEIREMVALVRQARAEPNPGQRMKAEEALQSHFRGLVKGETDEADPRLDGLYRALAAALIHSPEIDLSRGRGLVDARLGDLAPRLREHGAAYRLLSEAEASVQSELFRTLPPSAQKALLLVYFYGLEEYLSYRLRGLIPAGATLLLGERGHINVRRRGWEAQWAGLTLGNLLFVLDHNTHFFVADVERWATEVEPLLKEAVDARNRTAHPSKDAPPLDRVRDLVYGAIPAVESILRWPKGPVAS